MPSPVRLFGVDAFADAPFAGNPAAVCLFDPPDRDDDWRQAVAAEMNLSETAFVSEPVEEEDGRPVFGLRWFTPAVEVDLCGHATLAAAHVLWERAEVPLAEPIVFETRSGRLVATRSEDGAITLDFPADKTEAIECPVGLGTALGLSEEAEAARGRDDLLVVISREDFDAIAPDFGRLAEFETRGVVVTAAATADEPCDFVSRFFAPRCGIDEDPVTGSAHCLLGPFWAERSGKNDLVGRQLSARGGTVGVGVRGDRVELSGRSVTVWRGELVV